MLLWRMNITNQDIMDSTDFPPPRVNTTTYRRHCKKLQRRIRQTLGWGGQGQVADALGVSRSYLSGVLAGRVTSRPCVARIEAYLDSIDSLNRV